MSIFDLTFSTYFKNILAPSKRTPRHLAWGISFLTPLQWLRDLAFGTYLNGDSSAAYNISNPYVKGNTVVYIDRAVYECIVDAVAGILPTNTTYWHKKQDIYIGLNERMQYNSQKLRLDFMLNKWFGTTFRPITTYTDASNDYYLPKSDIYVKNNFIEPDLMIITESAGDDSYIYDNTTDNHDFIYETATSGNYSPNSFTIYFTLAVYNALSAVPSERDKIIRAFVDKYVIAGITYNITTY